MPKVYTLTIQNRVAATVFAVAILGLGAVFFALGLALLAGLAVAGGVLGAGYSLLRRVRGRVASDINSLPISREELNPVLEVQPTRPAILRSVENDPE